jgi:hypothetical protein
MGPNLHGVVRGHFVGFDKYIQPAIGEVRAIHRDTIKAYAEGCVQDYWFGTVETPSQNGDCGRVLVSNSPHATILGLHQLGGNGLEIANIVLHKGHVDEALKHFGKPLISASAPKLTAPDAPRTLGPLKERSPLRWLPQGNIVSHGSFTDYARVPRSKVNFTHLGEKILEERNWERRVGKPDLASWSPWHHALNDITAQTYNIKASTLAHCVEALVADITTGLPADSLRDLQKVDRVNAINGVPGVAHLDKMNFSTSMGEPWCTTKKKYLVPAPTDSIPLAQVFTPDVMERIQNIEDDYKNGIRACPVYSGQKKDEARPFKKLVDGKVRIFTGSPVDHSVVVRQYLHTFTKVMTENKVLFECAIGCSAQSLEWEQLHEYLVQHGFGRMIAGDYGKFDKKMTSDIILAVFDVIIAVLRFAGWSEEELSPIYGIAEDTAFPFVNLGGDLVMTYGMNPSGHPLTVIVNSIANSLYMRYAYCELGMCEAWDFKTFVSLLTYGDDNAAGVSEERPWFNHTAISGALAHIGVEYTMAQKDAESVPYICMDQISFLKRLWRFDADVGALLCPLEEASIEKMLTVCVEGKTLSPEQHQIEVMNSAAGEWFFYGKERFERERRWMVDIATRHGLEPEMAISPFPTWDDLFVRFWKSSVGVPTKRLGENYVHPCLAAERM